MATLKVPGATLYYEVNGKGTPFVLIPGANGDGFIFEPLAKILSEHYMVIRLDRRGYSRSTLDAPLGSEYHDKDCGLRLTEDANDVAALIEHLGAGPAIVFGSSSGAQVALQVLIDHPECVKKLLCHEVPLLRTFSDFENWERNFLGLHELFTEKGAGPAMAAFVQAIAAGDDTDQFEGNADEEPSPYAVANMDFWFEYELRQYARYPMDFETLGRRADKLILINGAASEGKMPELSNKFFAKKFGLPIAVAPNSHFGYAEKPGEFAQVLLDVLS